MYQTIKKLFSNPIINFVLATLVALAFFLFSKNTTEVSYAVSTEEIIVSQSKGTPELTFNWKGEAISEELKRLKVAIWNSGNSFIDYSAISKSINFQIKLSGDITAMSQKISSVSRENLNIESAFHSESKEFIDISFHGDDALEINDGIVISIFYVGSETPKVELLGRVKGIKGEFDLVKWGSIKSPIDDSNRKLLYIFGFLLICGFLLIIPYFNIPVNKKWTLIYKFTAMVSGLIICSLPFVLFIGLANVWYFGVSWVL